MPALTVEGTTSCCNAVNARAVGTDMCTCQVLEQNELANEHVYIVVLDFRRQWPSSLVVTRPFHGGGRVSQLAGTSRIGLATALDRDNWRAGAAVEPGGGGGQRVRAVQRGAVPPGRRLLQSQRPQPRLPGTSPQPCLLPLPFEADALPAGYDTYSVLRRALATVLRCRPSFAAPVLQGLRWARAPVHCCGAIAPV